MKNLFVIFLICIGISATAFSAPKFAVIEGRIDLIKQDYIVIENRKYFVISSASYKKEPECWVVQPTERYQTTYKTLRDIGYVDKARVTIKDGIVHKIERLDM